MKINIVFPKITLSRIISFVCTNWHDSTVILWFALFMKHLRCYLLVWPWGDDHALKVILHESTTTYDSCVNRWWWFGKTWCYKWSSTSRYYEWCVYIHWIRIDVLVRLVAVPCPSHNHFVPTLCFCYSEGLLVVSAEDIRERCTSTLGVRSWEWLRYGCSTSRVFVTLK